MKVSSKITGIGAYIPERKITNEDVLNILKKKSEVYLEKDELNEILEISMDRLKKAGNETRYWCRDDEYCTDIAYNASIMALEDAGVLPEDIDMIIFTGMSKAFVEPATAHVLRHKLRAINANVIDTQDACTSFIKSLEIAHSLIANGSYKKILIAAGERTYDWADMTCKTKDELAWKFGSLTIGDGAGALVLEATDEAEFLEDEHHMNFSYSISDGQYHLCTIGLNHSLGERYKLYTHTPDLFKAVYVTTVDCVKSYFSNGNFEGAKFDNLFYHDVGRLGQNIILNLLKELDVNVNNTEADFYSEYGNVASISMPLSMYRAKQKGILKEGNSAICVIPASGAQCGIVALRF